MFQNFDAPSRAHPITDRLVALRAHLARAGLAGFVVPHADEYQGEYIPASAERLAWLTGFTGSAGAAVVLANEAAVFVDGRYTLQVREQVHVADFMPEDLIAAPPHTWLKGRLKAGDRLPPTRSLARRLGVNRNTVVAAYDALATEGVVSSHTGRGTFLMEVGGTPARPADRRRSGEWPLR